MRVLHDPCFSLCVYSCSLSFSLSLISLSLVLDLIWWFSKLFSNSAWVLHLTPSFKFITQNPPKFSVYYNLPPSIFFFCWFITMPDDKIARPENRSLALDECAFCHQRGHWKYHCPKKRCMSVSSFQQSQIQFYTHS